MENVSLKIKNGFTLAEVLITLVIIGVIAAMTIPTLINKTQDQELKSQFSKAYSTVAQALTKTVINDFYGYAACTYYKDVSTDAIDYGRTATADCTTFFNVFAKNLSIQKLCDGNAKSGGCIPTYQSYNNASGCGGYNQSNMNSANPAYVLSNGQIIIPYKSSFLHPLFLIDINGQKGPNAYGKDLFGFKIVRNSDNLTAFYLDYEACEFPVSGGRTTREMVQYALAGKK